MCSVTILKRKYLQIWLFGYFDKCHSLRKKLFQAMFRKNWLLFISTDGHTGGVQQYPIAVSKVWSMHRLLFVDVNCLNSLEELLKVFNISN